MKYLFINRKNIIVETSDTLSYLCVRTDPPRNIVFCSESEATGVQGEKGITYTLICKDTYMDENSVYIETISSLPENFVENEFYYDNESKMILPIYSLPSEKRRHAYDTQQIIDWEDEKITVTSAADKWQYYSSENNAKSSDLTRLIIEAKQKIREQYPD